MGRGVEVESRAVAELSPAERALWAQFRAANPALYSPYFDLRYIEAAARVAPGAAVAVIRRHREVAAFLPFQRRGGLLQPLAAPLTDYHGLIAPAGAEIDLRQVVEQLGARRFRFNGLMDGAADGGEGAVSRPAMIADLSEGYDAYLEGRKAAGQWSAVRDKQRCLRQLTKAHGRATLTWSRDPEVLRTLMDGKRDQMRRTGQHDVFSTPWTRELLEALLAIEAPDFGLRVAALEVDGRQIAAEVGLLSGETYHFWFPIYDRDFARFSPGALLSFETLKALAEQGVRHADFGPGAESYKKLFADPGPEVLEGDIHIDPLIAQIRRLVQETSAVHPPIGRRLASAYERIERRLDRIAACEPTLEGQIGAVGRSLGALGLRHRKLTLSLGVGLSLAGAGLLLTE